MTTTGLEPGGYLEVMLQQVCEETSPNKLKLYDNKMLRFPLFTGAPWQ